MLKVGILGFGFMGRVHAAAYLQMNNVEVAAIGGCNESRLQGWRAARDVQFYADANALISEANVDVIDICLPTDLHEEFITKAAAKGLHVICEKPLALTLAEVDRIADRVRESDITFMVAQVLRYFPYYKKCRELLAGGDLGSLLFASASRLAEPPVWAQWIRDAQRSGGALFDLQVHDVDYLVQILGLPKSVYAMGPQSGSTHVVTLLSYEHSKAVIEAGYDMPAGWPFTSALRLLGTSGCLDYVFRVAGNVNAMEKAQHSLTFYREGRPPFPITVDEKDPYVCELERFVNSVCRQEKLPSSLQEARDVAVVLEGARQSIRCGLPIRLSNSVMQAEVQE
jgi:UDP-N-acetylglucosamine 3-dehydrogenase